VAPGTADTLTVHVRDADDEPMAARVRVLNAGGTAYPLGPNEPLLSHGTPDRYFYVDGSASLVVPGGPYTVRADRGFEWQPVERPVQVTGDTSVTLRLMKVFDMRSRGWLGGDTHVHTRHTPVEYTITPALAHCIARAEDLGLMWCLDQAYEFTGTPHAVSDAQSILYYSTEYRNQVYGHVALLGLRTASPLGCCWPGSPPAPTLTELYDAWRPGFGQGMVLCHPRTTEDFFDDSGTWPWNGLGRGLPLLAALASMEALDVAAYSNSPDLVLDDWYDLLSTGVRITPSAGTDATIDDYWSGPAGGYRTYAQTAVHDADAWVEALKLGRTFVTNYPLLPEFTVDGAMAGSVLDVAAEATHVSVHARVECLTALERLEVIVNGTVAATFPLTAGLAGRTVEEVDVDVPLPASAWVAVRVAGTASSWFPMAPSGFLFAHTAPVYVIRGGEPIRDTAAAGRLLDRVADVETFVLLRDVWDSEQQREGVLAEIDAARAPFAENFTEPSLTFDLVYPVDGSTVFAGTPVSFDWSDAVDPEPGDVLHYELGVSADSTFASGTALYPVDESEFTHLGQGFVPGTTYFWRAEAIDRGGNRTWATPAFARFRFESSVVSTETAPSPRTVSVAPNPARNAVVVSFPASARGGETVRVLDARGREVTTLGHLDAGTGRAEVRWDLTGTNATPVASGRYWIELSSAGRRHAVKPIVVVR